MIKISITLTGGDISERVKSNLQAVVEKVTEAATAAMNMAASMISEQAKANIAAGGRFGSRWTEGLHVTLDNMRLSMSHDIPYADIFETGGTISGHPLLWLPLNDNVQRGSPMVPAKNSKIPLMLSINDKKPQLFGTASVTIPKKWDLNGVIQNVMSNFADYFAQSMGS